MVSLYNNEGAVKNLQNLLDPGVRKTGLKTDHYASLESQRSIAGERCMVKFR